MLIIFYVYSNLRSAVHFHYLCSHMCTHLLVLTEMRQDWAAGWSKLLAPGGELVTMVYPVDPTMTTGPPWPVTPELYKELLLPAGAVGGQGGLSVELGGG